MLSSASADANKQLQHHTRGRSSLLLSSSHRASMTTPRSVSVAAAGVLWLLVAAGRQSCPSSTTTTWQANAEATHSKHHDNAAMHPPVYVDTKYWIRSTEFGERDNWIQQLRPCSLAERIKMNEQSVVSMGSSMDALGGSLLNANFIKELTLAENGMLLLEEDLPEDPIDSAFVDYLKAIGDCADGETASADGNTQTTTRRRLFEFQPDNDEMSWFNPENWASTPNEYNIEEWIPESHQVPCSDDVVVFGDRHNMLETFLELGERDKTASFKVNFRPSLASFKEAEGGLEAFAKVDSLRVSKLRIGDRHYDQQQFEKLIYSSDYSDILFQFNDSKSVLARQDGYMGNPLLTIDESSLVRDTSENICLDEAGCLCGNERAETMKVICSFHEPLTDDDLPCHDPIYSAGHCNKICATSLTISMEPSRFSERFINSIIEKIMKDDSRAGSVLVGPRRIDNDKYEILFRYIPNEEEHWSSAGIELEYAKLVLRQLERGSTKSFYGIGTITTRSSRQWRRNNRSLIFWLTSATLSLISVAVIVRKEADAELRFGIDSALETQGWLNNIWDQTRQKAGSLEVNSGSSMRLTDELERTGDNHSESLTNIPLLDLDEDDTEKNSR